MNKPPKPSPFYLSNRAKPWGLRIRVDGKYKPTYFATQQERDAKMAELTREIQAEERPLTAEERSWIRTIRSAAKASGVDEQDTSAWLFATLSERSRKDAEQANKGLVPTTPTLTQARTEWLAEEKLRNTRPKSFESSVRFSRFFVQEVGVERVGDLSRKNILRWITERYIGNASRATLRSYITPFLTWCAEKNWISRDAFLRLKWPKVHADEKNIVWASPGFVSRFLKTAHPDIVPALALGAFAGLRPEECQRVKWEHINFEIRQMPLPGTVTKNRKPRLLYELPETVWLWLETVPDAHRVGKVFPKSKRSWRRDFAESVKAAGIKRWPKDALRKGFATHGALLKGQDWTKNNMGHVDHKLLDAVYRGAISRVTADEYFAVTPEALSYKPQKNSYRTTAEPQDDMRAIA